MGGGTPRAATTARPRHPKPCPSFPTPLFRHSCAPLPSFLRRQEPTQAPTLPPQFIPPPFQGGGEVGGGTPRAATNRPPAVSQALPVISAPLFRHSCAGRNPPRHPLLLPNSSLPPSRGEVRWGVGHPEPPPPPARGIPSLARHSCAPPPSFLRRQEPPPITPRPPPPPRSPPPRCGTAPPPRPLPPTDS